MSKVILMIFMVLLWQPALGAKKKKYWYKVESEKAEKKSKKSSSYPYDSLEINSEKRVFREIGFWPNQPNVAVGGGFFADKAFFKDSQTNRFFLSTHLSFRNKAWHRIVAGASLIQNNSFILDASWHYLPSRKPIRSYYGFGVAHSLYSNEEFRSLLKVTNYFITANYGIEILQKKGRGFRGEGKIFLGSGTYAVQVLISYIFHL